MVAMNIKKFGLSRLLSVLCCWWLMSTTAFATTNEAPSFLSKVIPDFATAQYAGNIGKYALGVGWEYGSRKQWMTELLVGWVPKEYNKDDLYVMTLKQTYTPWTFQLPITLKSGATLKFSPLTYGLYANATMGSKLFWFSEPNKQYGRDYYSFATGLRFALTFGEKLTYEFPESMEQYGKACELYYEVSLNDLSVVSSFNNRHLTLLDIIVLGVGARWKF